MTKPNNSWIRTINQSNDKMVLVLCVTLWFYSQGQNSQMKKVLIRMVGKRASMKVSSPLFAGCNPAGNTYCIDNPSNFLAKLGYQMLSKRHMQVGSRKAPGIVIRSINGSRGTFWKQVSRVCIIIRHSPKQESIPSDGQN